MSPSVTSLAVVCDWPLLRSGLAQAINTQPDLEITAFVKSVEDLSHKENVADIAMLINLQMSDQVASGQVARLHRQGYAVIVLSISETQSDAVLCIQAGTRGYLSRHTDDTELVTAVRAVAAGSSYFGSSLAGHSLPAPPPRITLRERQILQLVAAGSTDREIAAELNITENTVHTHLERLRRKSGSRRRADLTRLALKYGVLGDRSAE
ncbi:LuxR C-terminal-related transcriptional regulator [Streptomyces sp. NPDC059378]|uniref:LuxR C-terminal-related transcriptional regulator n=1 Tax=Streptomyces sp. NPDC059378 TaxID=3346815 RepID=UPI0036AAC7D6